MGIVIEFILNFILNVVFSVFKNTSFYKKLEQWKSNVHIRKRLHSRKEINEKIIKFNFHKIGKTKQLNGNNLKIWYSDDMHEMNIIDNNGEKRSIRIPYLEIVNFIKNPNTKITINCSEDDPLLLDKKFSLSEDLQTATQRCLDEVIKNNPKTTDDFHPRLAAMKRIGENEYECMLEETNYFTQIRSNLSMDYRFNIDGRCSTMRTMERERHEEEKKVWESIGMSEDALHPKCLTSLENSMLANVIGVSAIWCMGDLSNPKYYLMPRNKKVGVYKRKLGMPSGDIESPQKQGHRFGSDSLIDYLKWEMAREFAEETGICDKNRNIDDYSINVDKNKIKYETDLEIIPLALTREMLRGGKPQMFFLIKTEEIDKSVLKKCFLASLGVAEFSNALVTTATLSAEAACNYLYAQEYIHRNRNDEIDLS